MRTPWAAQRWLALALWLLTAAVPAAPQQPSAPDTPAQTRAELRIVRGEVQRLRGELGRTRKDLAASRQQVARQQGELTAHRTDLAALRSSAGQWARWLAAALGVALLLALAALLRSRRGAPVEAASLTRAAQDARRLREALDAADARARRAGEG